MLDCLGLPLLIKGNVKIFDLERPDEVLYQRKNVICNGVSYLFAQLLMSNTSLISGVWGLAIGAGGSSNGWSASEQPDPVATQTAMVSEIKRKQLAQTKYLDADGNPTTTMTAKVSFLTILNATSDAISTPIREMGLIGGGITGGTPTNMLTAPYFDPASPNANTVTLINYVTMPAFILPAGVSMGIEWVLSL